MKTFRTVAFATFGCAVGMAITSAMRFGAGDTPKALGYIVTACFLLGFSVASLLATRGAGGGE